MPNRYGRTQAPSATPSGMPLTVRIDWRPVPGTAPVLSKSSDGTTTYITFTDYTRGLHRG
jgi:hypothetical protein